MNINTISRSIEKCVKNNNIAFKKHTILRMRQRNITVDDIKLVLEKFNVIEFYPDDYPFPSCLLLGYTKHKRPIHIIIAVDEKNEYSWIITVYEPTADKWEKNFKNRRKL